MLKKVVIGFVAFMVLLVAISFILPSKIHLEREISIKAEPEAIYPYLSNFKKFNTWSPWAKLDPNTKWTYEGEGVGSKMSWKSEDRSVGAGTQEILEARPYVHVKNKLTFDGNDSFATYTLTPDPEGKQTKIVWAFDADMGMNPFAKYMGLVIEKMLAPDYEKGLKNLKKVVEKS